MTNRRAEEILVKAGRGITNWGVNDLGALVDSFDGDSSKMKAKGFRRGKYEMLKYLFSVQKDLREKGGI